MLEFGIGTMIGSFICGFAFHDQRMFWIGGMLMAVSLVIWAVDRYVSASSDEDGGEEFNDEDLECFLEDDLGDYDDDLSWQEAR